MFYTVVVKRAKTDISTVCSVCDVYLKYKSLV